MLFVRRGGLVAVLGLLALVGCKGPGAAFVGDWAGTYECGGSWRSTGNPYAEGPLSQMIIIDETADGAIFIAGRGCTIWLSPLSDMQASAFTTSPCRVSLDDPPVTLDFEVTSGVVQRRGEVLTYSISYEISANDGADVADVTCTFDGDRI